ncbi:MAG: CBS domain-containing protein [Thermoplasmata archaeon]
MFFRFFKKEKDEKKDEYDIKVRDMTITDEFQLAKTTDSARDIMEKIVGSQRDAILVMDPRGEVVGCIKAKAVINAIMQSDKKPEEIPVTSFMERNILKVNINSSIRQILPQIKQRRPEAVVVVDDKNVFQGYFSQTDIEVAAAELGIEL